MSDQARGARTLARRGGTRKGRRADGHVVASGKGGVGTSTAALLLAFAARRHGPVVLVDAQEGLGGLARIIGLDESVGTPDEAPGRGRPRRVDLAPDLALVHGATDGAPDPARRSALRRMALAAGDPTVIVDAGSRPATVVQALNDYGSHLMVVIGPDPVSPAASYALAKTAWRHRPETLVSALANRVDAAGARLAHDAVRTAARRFADRPVGWLGHLPVAGTLEEEQGPDWSTLDAREPALVEAAVAACTRMLRLTRLDTSTLSLVK